MNESKPKKKIVIHMLVRNIIQLVSFLLLPGLFIDSFNGINALIFGIKSGDMSGVGLALLPTVLFLVLTLIFGRFFCGFLCAFGTLGDILYFAGSRLFKFKFKVPEKADRILKYLKYVILVWVLVLWIFGIETFRSANPWTAFGCMFSLPPDFSYAFTSLLAGSLILIVILIGSVFIERFFCRYLCPLGAIYSLVSRLRFVKLRKPRKSCGNCRLCTNKCKMGIPLYQTDTVKSGECINCMQCVSPCPRKNIKLKFFSKYAAPLTASVIAVAASVLYLIGSIAIPAITAAAAANAPVKVQTEAQTSASTDGTDSTESSETIASQVLNKYADGVYEGSGTGYHNGTTTVAVTIEGGLITNIEILSTRDDTSYYKRALTTISSRIIEAQDPDVDAVSGATFSSEGIIEAVADALKKAENQGGG
ncbi:MAG: 4Fe-4S binding protein, partial [Parasporobacterium sp.]|nr:4Fe-4S binding protein [Parasporobacterium sp.]